MNCTLCQRKLKNPSATGMGKTCQKKHRNQPETAGEKSVRVQPLFAHSRRPARRSYVVFTSPRKMVTINELQTGERFAKCECLPADGVKCLHIELVAEIDRATFPQDLAQLVAEAAIEVEPATAEPLMINLSDRQSELTEALSRAGKSRLTVFPNFEPNSFVVVNADTKSEYRIALKPVAGKALASCNCEDFKRRGRICKHLSAAVRDCPLDILVGFSSKNSMEVAA